ncbi:MAG: hypothetical protein P8048_00150 [Calditrichia bacterium]
MVFLLVVLSVVLFITIDYLIQRRRKRATVEQAEPENLYISKTMPGILNGVFLQPGFTWSKILDNGNLLLGIQPMLLGLVGNPDEIETVPEGQKIGKGGSLLKVRKGSKLLDLKSPVHGSIVAINPEFQEISGWDKLSQNWIYAIKPEKVSSEIPGWIIADKTKNWINTRYEEVKSFFMKNLPRTELGSTMADGGDLPIGIMSKFDEKFWKEFEHSFLN